MTSHGDYEIQSQSDKSWVMVDDQPFSKDREPQFKDCNRSSVEQAAATSGASAPTPPVAGVHPSDLEDDYNPFKHYPGSLESGNTDATDATLRPADNAETPSAPLNVQKPTLFATHAISVAHLGPYLRQLPQHTHKDIRAWAAGDPALFVPFAPAQDSVRVEHGSAISSASHSRAGVQMDSADVAVLGAGMWSSHVPHMRMSILTLSNTESSYYGSQLH